MHPSAGKTARQPDARLRQHSCQAVQDAMWGQPSLVGSGVPGREAQGRPIPGLPQYTLRLPTRRGCLLLQVRVKQPTLSARLELGEEPAQPGGKRVFPVRLVMNAGELFIEVGVALCDQHVIEVSVGPHQVVSVVSRGDHGLE